MPTAVFCLSDSIVIQEIQIAGETSTDEYVVLKNISNISIDLTGWKLTKKTKSGKEYTLHDTFVQSLEPDQEIVIGHNDTLIHIDEVYSHAQSLATNNTLTLYNNTGDIIDLIGWGSTGSFENFATENPSKYELLIRVGEDTDNNYLDFTLYSPNQLVEETEEEHISDFAHTGSIIINELLPNPDGSDLTDEWIEIKNIDKATVDLTGWILSDNSTKYIFDPDDLPNNLINPEGMLVLSRAITGISLNNTTDETLTLADPEGTVSSTISYTEEAKDKTSLIWYEGAMEWTGTPTPWRENIFTPTQKEVLGSSTKKSQPAVAEMTTTTIQEPPSTELDKNITTDPSEIVEYVPLERINGSYVDQLINTTGIVTATPNLFGKTYFYIANEYGGVRIYSSKKSFPNLSIGDNVRVTGTLSESRNELQLKTSQISDITILDHNQELVPQTIQLSDISDDFEGNFIEVTGEVTSKTRSQFFIDDGSDEARVYISANTDISTQNLTIGDTITVIGILSETTSGFRILPRSMKDLQLHVSTTTGAITPITIEKNKKYSTHFLITIFSIVILASLLLVVKHTYLSKNKNTPSNDDAFDG